MNEVRFQVLGYKDFNRKADNKAMTIVSAMSACTSADNAKGQFGHKVTDFFLPDESVGTLTVDCVGKEFLPEYGINGFGKPTLTGFTFKEWK